jgi:hypothetical protein
MECGLDAGHRSETCTLCGARSRVNHLRLFGFGGDYGRQIGEGPLSRFIQERDGVKCYHKWRGYSFTGGGVLFAWHGSGESILADIAFLDALPPRFADLLRSKAAGDPQFAGRLVAIVQGNWDAKTSEYLIELEAEGRLWCAGQP